MKIFVTWSGEKSKAAALALRQWIPDVINTASVWMSEVDIPAGDRWSAAIARELEGANFGVICITKSNAREPWVLFEAGALAKELDNSYVCPYLVDMQIFDLPQGPLNQFQAKQATEGGTWDLVVAINEALGEIGLPADRLQRSFFRCWPELERQLKRLPTESAADPPARSTVEMLREVLDLARDLTRRMRGQDDLIEALTRRIDGQTHAHVQPPISPELTTRNLPYPKDFAHLRQEPQDIQAFLDETRGS